MSESGYLWIKRVEKLKIPATVFALLVYQAWGFEKVYRVAFLIHFDFRNGTIILAFL
jgi:hypothetical protein